VLSRTNLSESSVAASSKSQSLNSLAPLEISCLSFSDPRPLFSIACSLFSKNTGGVVPPRHLRILGGVRHRTFIDFQLLPFHQLTNPFFRNLFVFRFICVAGGWRDTTPQFLKAKGSTMTCTEEESKIQAIMKLADGPGDRWPRAIGAGGKSGHRRRRLARAGDEVRATRLVTPGGGHAGSAAKWSFSLTRVASSSTRRCAAQLRKVPQRIYRRRNSTVASRRETCETSSKNPGLPPGQSCFVWQG